MKKPKQISRRKFIKQSSLAASVTFITPALLSSCNSKISANDKVNLAMIGVGNRGSGLLRNFLSIPETQVVAICDVFQNRREKFSKLVDTSYAAIAQKVNYKSCDSYHLYEEFLDRKDIDAVVIVTPDHWHVPIAYAAVKAGKHVYVEKPLGQTIKQGQILRKLVKKKKVVFQYGTQQRSDSRFRLAAELVRNKKIGELKKIDVWCDGGKGQSGINNPSAIPEGFDYDRWLGPAPNKPYTYDRCTNLGSWFIYDYALGFIAGWGAHPLDIAQWGNKLENSGITELEGSGEFFKSDNLFDTICSWDIKGKYQNGVELQFMSANKAELVINMYRDFHDHGTTFIGTKGWVSVDRNGIIASHPGMLNTKFDEQDERLIISNNHQKNFIDSIRLQKQAVSSIEDAVQSDTISHLSNILIRSGSYNIKWDPEKEEIIDPTTEMKDLLVRANRAPYEFKIFD